MAFSTKILGIFLILGLGAALLGLGAMNLAPQPETVVKAIPRP